MDEGKISSNCIFFCVHLACAEISFLSSKRPVLAVCLANDWNNPQSDNKLCEFPVVGAFSLAPERLPRICIANTFEINWLHGAGIHSLFCVTPLEEDFGWIALFLCKEFGRAVLIAMRRRLFGSPKRSEDPEMDWVVVETWVCKLHTDVTQHDLPRKPFVISCTLCMWVVETVLAMVISDPKESLSRCLRWCRFVLWTVHASYFPLIVVSVLITGGVTFSRCGTEAGGGVVIFCKYRCDGGVQLHVLCRCSCGNRHCYNLGQVLGYILILSPSLWCFWNSARLHGIWTSTQSTVLLCCRHETQKCARRRQHCAAGIRRPERVSPAGGRLGPRRRHELLPAGALLRRRDSPR